MIRVRVGGNEGERPIACVNKPPPHVHANCQFVVCSRADLGLHGKGPAVTAVALYAARDLEPGEGARVDELRMCAPNPIDGLCCVRASLSAGVAELFVHYGDDKARNYVCGLPPRAWPS